MGTFWHKLKANKTKVRPRNWFFVDTEAEIIDTDDGGQIHKLKLGSVEYRRDGFDQHPAKLEVFDFTSALRFWHWIRQTAEKDRRCVLLGYNMGYDMLVLNGFRCLKKLGYTQKRVYVGQKVLILEFALDKQKLLILDAMNYFNGTLQQWGDVLDVPKLHVDFRNVTDKNLLGHCRRDVRILQVLWSRWLDFIDQNDLGTFSPTKASQALTAFRHRFMHHKIWVHAHGPATALERKAYTGGRTECFFIGKPEGKQFYKLDVNSMYAYIMLNLPVPCKFLRWVRQSDKSELHKAIAGHSVVALCRVCVPEPVFPYRDLGTLYFPVGMFWTHLTTPEVRYALLHDYIVDIRDVVLYEQNVLFAEFVKAMYSLRRRFQRSGDDVFQDMVKYLLNCLYGKFAQHSKDWVKQPKAQSRRDGSYMIYSLDRECWYRLVVIASEVWNVFDRKESYHSFTAISAHITAAARMYLWSLIVQANRRNVYYCDTDSLIVNKAGFIKLKNRLHPSKLGKLKLEYVSQNLEVFSPKDYKTDHESHCKGLKADAELIAPNTYRQLQWSKLQGSISAGTTGSVTLKPVVKHLEREYRKGIVQPSGSVAPFVIAD